MPLCEGAGVTCAPFRTRKQAAGLEKRRREVVILRVSTNQPGALYERSRVGGPPPYIKASEFAGEVSAHF